MTQFVLRGYNPLTHIRDGETINRGDLEALFTATERKLALAVAQGWFDNGWEPMLFSRSHDGTFRVLFNFKRRLRGRAA